jgi:3-oxoacyl-[acyl-carrier protein] reductase
MRLQNKVAIVTGSGQGNGQAMALGFVREGAQVVIADLNPDTAQATARDIEVGGGRALAVQVDVAKSDEVRRMARQTMEAFGRIDILVNNAGWQAGANFFDVTEADWNRMLAVNLTGPFLCARAVAPHMIAAGGGSILNISSIQSQVTHGPVIHYGTSKGGLVTLSKTMAVMLAPYKIRVNCLVPGIIQTAFNAAAMQDPDWRARSLARIPLDRFGTPEDLVGIANLLASDEASYITGAVVPVDGGWLALGREKYKAAYTGAE